jgi:hypothetical protein
MKTVGTLTISGTPEFVFRTNGALTLLQRSGDLPLIERHIHTIREARKSGIVVYGEPVFLVGQRTWQAPLVWYASAIAHDAYHVVLYRTAKQRSWSWLFRPGAWSGRDAERKCLTFQLQVLQKLEAPLGMLCCIKGHLLNPTYQVDYWNRRTYLRRLQQNW